MLVSHPQLALSFALALVICSGLALHALRQHGRALDRARGQFE